MAATCAVPASPLAASSSFRGFLPYAGKAAPCPTLDELPQKAAAARVVRVRPEATASCTRERHAHGAGTSRFGATCRWLQNIWMGPFPALSHRKRPSTIFAAHPAHRTMHGNTLATTYTIFCHATAGGLPFFCLRMEWLSGPAGMRQPARPFVPEGLQAHACGARRDPYEKPSLPAW